MVTGQGDLRRAILNRLRILSELGLGRAGESLTGLLGHRVHLTVTELATLPVGALFEKVAGTEERASAGGMAGLTFRITGESTGQMVILFSRRTVFRILRLLLGTPEEPRSLSAQERSAIQEVGNILASSFLTGLGDLLERRLMPTPPELSLDDLPGLMQKVRAGVPQQASEVLVVQALVEDPDQQMQGRFFFVPEMESLGALFQGAGADPAAAPGERPQT